MQEDVSGGDVVGKIEAKVESKVLNLRLHNSTHRHRDEWKIPREQAALGDAVLGAYQSEKEMYDAEDE